MTKKTLMKIAHRIAKEIVYKVGDYQIALSMAMKYVWNANKCGKKRFGEMAMLNAVVKLTTRKVSNSDCVGNIPAWIIRKNLDQNEAYAVLNECDGVQTIRETEKAVLVRFNTSYGYVEMWSPKSVLAA